MKQHHSLVKILFVDLSSAFNTIQLHLLVRKLMDIEVNPRLIVWITDFLLNQTQEVSYTYVTSSPKSINTGAPHGCVLSTMLYTLYTNERRTLTSNHIFF